jgi:hypothetical protein
MTATLERMDQIGMEQMSVDFFTAYAKRFNDYLQSAPEAGSAPARAKLDVRGVIESFAPYFVESSPVGVRGGKNGWLFKRMVPRGFAHYVRIGAQRMEIAGLDSTLLDAFHALCKVSWHSEYARVDGTPESIDFEVIYLLRIKDGPPKIFAYITGDEEQALKDHGVI